MVKSNQHIRTAIVIIFMLAASPLTVSHVQAESSDKSDLNSLKEISKSTISNRENATRVILTEQVQDGKLQVRYFEIPQGFTSEQIKRALSFEGETSGWTFVNAKAYSAGIVLFNGKAIKVGDNAWGITQGLHELDERRLDLEISGNVIEQNVILHETASNELTYRVIFSGKVAQAGEDNTFAVAFLNASLKDTEVRHAIQLFELGENTDESNNYLQTDGFQKSTLVG